MVCDSLDISTLLPWSEPVQVQMRSGAVRTARTSFPTESFWELWRERKEELREAGITVNKPESTGRWTVYWWTEETAREIEVDISVLSQGLQAKLRSFQIEKTAHAVISLRDSNCWGYLNAWEGGTGKTYSAVATAVALNKKLVVLCRKSAITAWRRVAVDHFGMRPCDVTVTNPEAVRTGKTPLGTWVKSGRIETFRWNIEAVKDSLIVFDEVHGYGGFDSTRSLPTKNGKMLVAIRNQNLKCLCLSATAANTPARFFALGYVLGLHNGDDFYRWTFSNGCSMGDYGLQFTCGLTWARILHEQGGQAELEQRQAHVMKSISDRIFKAGKGSRINKAEIPGFPASEVIPVGIDFAEVKKINLIYSEMIHELTGLGLKSLHDPRAMETMMEARRKTEMLKVPDICLEVEDLIEQGYSVAVFVSFKATVAALKERLKTNCVIVGNQSQAERDRCIDGFQADKERVIIGNIQAAGESISLHDLHGRYPRVSLITPSFWADSILQALFRIHRDGARTKSINKIFFALNTIEEDAYKNFLSKLSRLNAFNEGTIITDSDLTGRLNKLLNA